ncbi:carbohydrate binding domain-containing protein [Micromonospora antibiotica]|uniref:carbohydrate binding domain-containing protein n=1 Tax=Micromonospora antibiotica TaxID=2807623 RepID=UPI001FC935CD|nr:carbohydrate binding domain-containing protein [Micromonospora antibiotica]
MRRTTTIHRRRAGALALVVGVAASLLPLTAAAAANTVTVYYQPPAAWGTSVNIHYGVDGGSWTAVPGVAMEAACAGWRRRTVDLGTATGLTAAFNNNAGTWDNNNGADYTLRAGRSTVRGGLVTPDAADPCQPVTPDTTPPATPAGLTATAAGLSVTLSWTAATDDRAVTGYELTRTGGTGGATTVTTTTTRYVAYDLAAGTAYTWTVRALDAAGNRSAASAPATATTGTTPPVGGSPLGGDPREDSIYFVMTARFADGDATNNRGGSQHVRSGNAANDDPMFRGDFKGLVDKLDYIKGLGFSAIWITPVVLNRSDYDFHGYHGWDFHRVDPRLESPGASYQQLINAAHAKGMKIFQDVVYNHSSRWGAKGLFVPTVYGVRDEQWKWYYDQPQAGREYDPMVEHDGNDPTLTAAQNAKAKGRPCNGDVWSGTAPTANRCLNWGTPNGAYSQEGYTVYHCQWPVPTGKLFPADLYHQCWIGNWRARTPGAAGCTRTWPTSTPRTPPSSST